MRSACFILLVIVGIAGEANANTHSITFGRALPVKLLIGPSENKTLDITVRPLYVDGKLKEFTTGNPHDVTEQEFVVRRAYRINDVLPDDPHKNARWLWERGNWLVVNRVSGKVMVLNFPDFDPFYSEVSWYRDYAAYCGVTSSNDRVVAVVVEIAGKKPLFRKTVGQSKGGDTSDSNCLPPRWERQPPRVTFFPVGSDQFTVNVSGHFADQAEDSDE